MSIQPSSNVNRDIVKTLEETTTNAKQKEQTMPNLANTATEVDYADLDLLLAEVTTDGVDDQPIMEDVIEDEILMAEEADIVELEETTLPAELDGFMADAALADDVLRDLDLAVTTAEAYEAQTAAVTGDPSSNAGKVKAVKTPKTPKTPRVAGAAATPRTPRDISTVPAEFFILQNATPVAAADAEAVKTATLALIPKQVKVAEKFENLFTALSVKKAPSTYVMIAFKLLDEKKSVTSADIVSAYKTAGLGEGTARSQSGQIMNLFATVGIADRAGQVLTLNTDSLIADRIRDL